MGSPGVQLGEDWWGEEGVTADCVREGFSPAPLFCVRTGDHFEPYVFVIKRNRMTQLPCWLTSLIVLLMTRSHHLSQSLTPNPLLRPPLVPNKVISLDIDCCFCLLPQLCHRPEAPLSAGFSRYPEYSSSVSIAVLLSSTVQRRNHRLKESLVIEFCEI